MATKQPTYKQQPVKLRYFKIHEFDSRDQPGTGELMRASTLRMIDDARDRADLPFKINSGYRTFKHNRAVGGVPGSAHTRGYGFDIHAPTLDVQVRIVVALREAGFTRFGIYPTWIHADNDPAKKPNVAWNRRKVTVEKGGDFSAFPFDPFTIGLEEPAPGPTEPAAEPAAVVKPTDALD